MSNSSQNQNVPRMRFTIKQMLIAVAGICIVLGAFVRGRELMGTGIGVVYGMVTVATLVLVRQAFRDSVQYRRLQQAITLLFATGVLAVLMFPAYFSPDVNHIISRHQKERTIQSQLDDALATDPRFASLNVECTHMKGIVVTVNGTIKSQQDLLDLRNRIFDCCPDVSSGCLHWELLVADSNVRYDDRDAVIFEDDPDPGRSSQAGAR